jgi:hypothetical protein
MTTPRIVNNDLPKETPALTDTISEEAWQLGCGILALIVGGFAGLVIIGSLP